MFALLKYSGLSGFILDKKWTENLYISNKSGIGIVKIKQAFKSCFNFLRIMKLTSVFLHSSITKIRAVGSIVNSSSLVVKNGTDYLSDPGYADTVT